MHRRRCCRVHCPPMSYASLVRMFASRLLCWCRSACVVLLFALIIGAKWHACATWMEILCIFSMCIFSMWKSCVSLVCVGSM